MDFDVSIREKFSSILERLYQLDESLPFRGFDDIGDTIASGSFQPSRPIEDFAGVREKLNSTVYEQDPWEFVNDMWIIFDSTWRYNQPSSKVFKCCTVVANIFDKEIDEFMKSLGYCCGRRYVFEPEDVRCVGPNSCVIQTNAKYYDYRDKYVFCVDCFRNFHGDSVTVTDASQKEIELKKRLFCEKKNDHFEVESFVKCAKCRKKFHRICVLYVEEANTAVFLCSRCSPNANHVEKFMNEFSASRLPANKLSVQLEDRVRIFLAERNISTDDVLVRVVSSYRKSVDVKNEMRKRFEKFPQRFPYTAKAILVFQKIQNVDVCIFGMHVQEYGSECPYPNTGCVYISYLDSVNFFRPKHLRSHVYHELMLGYLAHAKSLGYKFAHVWACPPSNGDDYMFYRHPSDQKFPDHDKLNEWYKEILLKGSLEGIIVEDENLLQKVIDGELTITDMPYFENDFWPNFFEDSIKSCNLTGDKLKAELASQIKLVIEQNKELFFVFRLLEETEITSSIIIDPDPATECDIMDGRENFLFFAREKNLEFSSLRRAKYSSMVLLRELRVQHPEQVAYVCNVCNATITARFHCLVCEDFDLCRSCRCKENHPHKLRYLKQGENVVAGSSKENVTSINEPNEAGSAEEQCHQILIHAQLCRTKNCQEKKCERMKRILGHFRVCSVKKSECPICRRMEELCRRHFKRCRDNACSIPICVASRSESKSV